MPVGVQFACALKHVSTFGLPASIRWLLKPPTVCRPSLVALTLRPATPRFGKARKPHEPRRRTKMVSGQALARPLGEKADERCRTPDVGAWGWSELHAFRIWPSPGRRRCR